MVKINLEKIFLQLYEKTSTELPIDVINSLKDAEKKETGSAKDIIKTILKNISIAKKLSRPLCQDTGTPIFYIYYPRRYTQDELKKAIINATKKATKKGFLRPNAVDTITNKNSGDNTGKEFPVIHFYEWKKSFLKIDLMLKGGGSENISTQYKLPDSDLNAGRDLDGVRKCVIDAVFKAQGNGCPPGIIGVGIGGDRITSMEIAKKSLFRKLNDKNENKELNLLEEKLFKEINELGIGPMGLGGKTTVLGVKSDYAYRVPASYFVSVAYMCWAERRKTLIYKDGKVSIK